MNSNASASSVLQKYQINPVMATRLETLQNSKIVLILDDSSSMNNVDSYKTSTRWNELSNFARIIVEIAAVSNPNGCDVHFLNMTPARNVRSFDQLSLYMNTRPEGLTPLSKTIQNVIKENPSELLGNRNLLIIIATDGEPTDDSGLPNIPEFVETLANRPSYVYTSIVACTDDKFSIGYLNGLDHKLPRLDVVDNYSNELAEVESTQGRSVSFTHGDYITKSLIGSIDPQLDRLDEPVPAPVYEPVPAPVYKPVLAPVYVPVEVPPQKIVPAVIPQREVKPVAAPLKKKSCSLRILSPDYSNKSSLTSPRKYNEQAMGSLQLKDIFCCQ